MRLQWLDQAIDRRFGPMIYLQSESDLVAAAFGRLRIAERLRRVGLMQ